MEIKEDNIIKAYNTATADQKSLLRAMFPDIDFEPKPKPAPQANHRAHQDIRGCL